MKPAEGLEERKKAKQALAHNLHDRAVPVMACGMAEGDSNPVGVG
jgi:hypothetical protein